MVDYFLFPLIAVYLSMATVGRVFRGTNSTRLSGLSGLCSFCLVMWLAGYFLYGLGLAACFLVLLLGYDDHLAGDEAFSASIAVRKNRQP